MEDQNLLELTTFLIVRNRVKYASDAARAIVEASTRAEGSVSIRRIMVDHASTPEAALEIRNLALQNGFEHRRYEDSIGVFAHWNRVILTAETKWVHVNHDDDLIDVDFFREFAATISKYPKADMFTCPSITIGPDNRMSGTTMWNWDPGIVPDPRAAIRHHCPIACTGFVFTSRLFHLVGGYDENLSYCGDWKFYWEAAAVGILAVSERPLLAYRVHEGSVTSLSGSSIDSIQEDLDLIDMFRVSTGLSPDYMATFFKIIPGCRAAAQNQQFKIWWKLFRIGLGLRPGFRRLIQMIYSARGFLSA